MTPRGNVFLRTFIFIAVLVALVLSLLDDSGTGEALLKATIVSGTVTLFLDLATE